MVEIMANTMVAMAYAADSENGNALDKREGGEREDGLGKNGLG